MKMYARRFMALAALMMFAAPACASDAPAKAQTMNSASAYDQPVAYSAGVTLTFPDFTLTYLGQNNPPPVAGAPTVSMNVQRFRMTGPDGQAQIVTLRSGQTSPAPLHFMVGAQGYILLSHRDSAGQALPADTLVVVKSQ